LKKKLFLGVLFFASFCFADTLILTNGDIVKGLVTKQDEKQIIIKTDSGVRSLKVTDVKKIFLVSKPETKENIQEKIETPSKNNGFRVCFDLDLADKWSVDVKPDGADYSTGYLAKI